MRERAITTTTISATPPIPGVYSSQVIHHKDVLCKIVNIPSANSTHFERPTGPQPITINIKSDAVSIQELARVPIMGITITPMRLIHELNRIAREEGMKCSVNSGSGKIGFRLTNRPDIEYTRDTMLPKNAAFIQELILILSEI
ncbi:MAG: hypothetical protein WC843_05180 [Candidatus Gracilibacteria bacterium]